MSKQLYSYGVVIIMIGLGLSALIGADNTPGHTWTAREVVTHTKLNDMQKDLVIDVENLKMSDSYGEGAGNGLSMVLGAVPFETVADMKAFDFTDVPSGTRVSCSGYYTAQDGLFGPDVYWDPTSTATGDNFLVFDPTLPAGNGRLVRTLEEGINVTWAGYRPSADGVETYASANDAVWAALKTHLDSNPNTVIIPDIEGQVFYYSATQEAAASCTYILNGTLKKKADVNAIGFDVPTGVDNVTLTGTGTIHANAQMTQPRAGGDAIRATDNENLAILGRIKVYHAEGHAINIRQPVNLTLDGLYVRNTYGSAKSGESTSGVNMDGIHIYNPTEAIIRNCDIKSIDDSLAITMLEAYTNETSGVMVNNCILQPVKAENTNVSGDGSTALVIGAGMRLTQENTETLCRLRDVTISDCLIIGGDAGMLLGTTGLTGTTKFVERLKVSNIHFVDIANSNYGSITAFADAGGGQVTVTSTGHGLSENDLISINGTTSYNGDFTATNVTANDFEITDTWVADDATGTWASNANMSLNRALTAAIWARGIANASFTNCTISNAGVPAVMTDIVENVVFENINAFGGIVDNNNNAVGNVFERAHYLIRGSQNASDRVYLRNVRSVDADGAGLAIIHDGGGGKEITNLTVQALVDNPNQATIDDNDTSAVYLLNMDPGEITDYDVEVINYTPGAAATPNSIELARNNSLIKVEKLAPVNLTSWHSDVYAAAGNWFTRIQLFSPTYTPTNHFEGYTGVLKIDQGTTHVTGTAQAGGSDTITLAAGESGLNDAFNGLTINLTGGTGSGQSDTILDYVGSTKVATVSSDWATPPDATTTYEIEDAGGDGLYSVPLAGGALDDKHVQAEFYIHVDSGSVNIIEDSTLGVVKDSITTTGDWLKIKKIWAPDQTSMRLGFVAAETPTTFYLGPVKIEEL